jgi:hypothetical protein
VWELLKRDAGGPGIEFIELFDHPAEYFGIGVRFKNCWGYIKSEQVPCVQK